MAETETKTQKPKKSTVYTRTGDKGTTQLFNGERRWKSNEVFTALGAIDELSAHLGLAREHCVREGNGLNEILVEIQSRLIDLMSSVATPRNKKCSPAKLRHTEFDASTVDAMEAVIDQLDAKLPTLTQFILPSGGMASSQLHICRAVCRRAERAVVPMLFDNSVEEQVGFYLNRLSAAAHAEQPEVTYKKHKAPANKWDDEDEEDGEAEECAEATPSA